MEQETAKERSDLSIKFVTCVQNALLAPVDSIQRKGGRILKFDMVGGPMGKACLKVEMNEPGWAAIKQEKWQVTDEPTIDAALPTESPWPSLMMGE